MKKLILIILFCPTLLFSQWTQQSVPSDISFLGTIDFINTNTGVAGGYYMPYNFFGRVIYTTNSGQNWYFAQIPDSTRGASTVQLINESTGYIAGSYNPTYSTAENKGLFLKTTNGGHSWFTLDHLPANVFGLSGMCFLDINTGFVTATLNEYAGVQEAILKTTNGGLNWNTLTTIDSVISFGIATLDGNTIIVYGQKELSDGPRDVRGFIIRSGNGGVTWTTQYFLNIFGFHDIHLTNQNTGFAVGGDTLLQAVIYKTTNGGVNWNNIYTLGPLCIYYGVDFNNTGTGFVVGYKVQYVSVESMLISRTTNYGNSWNNHFIPDTNNLLFTNCIADQNNWFACGGSLENDAILLKTTTGGVGIHPTSNEIPNKFSLHQNYPNPFNPSTKIRFDLHKTAHAKLIVFDILGGEVATLVDEELRAGSYEVDFNGSDYPSGVYFYRIAIHSDRLETNNFIETKRMVLVK